MEVCFSEGKAKPATIIMIPTTNRKKGLIKMGISIRILKKSERAMIIIPTKKTIKPTATTGTFKLNTISFILDFLLICPFIGARSGIS